MILLFETNLIKTKQLITCSKPLWLHLNLLIYTTQYFRKLSFHFQLFICIVFYHDIKNYQKLGILKQHLLSYNFCRSIGCAGLTCVLCLGSHKAVIKLRLWLRWTESTETVGRTNFHAVGGLRSPASAGNRLEAPSGPGDHLQFHEIGHSSWPRGLSQRGHLLHWASKDSLEQPASKMKPSRTLQMTEVASVALLSPAGEKGLHRCEQLLQALRGAARGEAGLTSGPLEPGLCPLGRLLPSRAGSSSSGAGAGGAAGPAGWVGAALPGRRVLGPRPLAAARLLRLCRSGPAPRQNRASLERMRCGPRQGFRRRLPWGLPYSHRSRKKCAALS